MSRADVQTMMKQIADQYVKASFPNRKVWVVTAREDDPTFHEALAEGWIERWGAGRTGNFTLTSAGQRLVMQLRD